MKCPICDAEFVGIGDTCSTDCAERLTADLQDAELLEWAGVDEVTREREEA